MAKKVFTKDVILTAAYELSFDRGIETITMRQIAKHLGCSVMPIYESFDSKEDLLNALSSFNETMYQGKCDRIQDRYYKLLQEGIKYPDFFLSVVEYDVHKIHSEEIIDSVCNLIRKEERLAHLDNCLAYTFNTRIEIFIVGLVYAYKTLPKEKKSYDKLRNILDETIASFIDTYSKK